MSENTASNTFDNEIDDLLAKIKAAQSAGHKLCTASVNIDLAMGETSVYVEFDLRVNQESEIGKIGHQACEVVNFNCNSLSFDQEEFDQCVDDFLRNIQSSRSRLIALLEHYDYLETLAIRYRRVTEARIEAKKVLRSC